MKSIRVISRLDIKGPNVIKGVHTEGLRVVGSPKELAERYYAEGADEIVYMDIVASLYERNLDFQQLKSVCDAIFIPFTVGGGIRSLSDIRDALRAGADKVAINTYVVKHPKFITEASHHFGSSCIVLSVEAKKIREGKWEAYTEGGREKTGLDAVEWIKKGIELGAGEVIVTSIDQDGTRKGYDKELMKQITAFARVPVVAHGGAGTPEDMAEIVKEARVDAVSASSIYHYGEYTIGEVKEKLFENNIHIRRV